MNTADKVNANPTVYSPVVLARSITVEDGDVDGESPEPFDALEVFEMIRHINDPEHPLTLEQLNVASLSLINVDDAKNTGARGLMGWLPSSYRIVHYHLPQQTACSIFKLQLT